jgi:hypothetical protein
VRSAKVMWLLGGEEGDQPESKATDGLYLTHPVKTEEIKT